MEPKQQAPGEQMIKLEHQFRAAGKEQLEMLFFSSPLFAATSKELRTGHTRLPIFCRVERQHLTITLTFFTL